VLVVHQNEPVVFWKSPPNKIGLRPEVVRLGRDEFCVLNAVPWVKLKSYLDWLEGSEEQDDWLAEVDAIGPVRQYAKILGGIIGDPPPLEDAIEILGADWPAGPARKHLPRAARAESLLLRHAFVFQRASFLPSRPALVLPALSTNALTEGASLLLWKSFHPAAQGEESSSDQIILRFLIGYLGSKLLNPKRKCNEVADLSGFLRKHSRSRAGRQKKKALVYSRALKLLQPFLQCPSPRAPAALPGILEIEACRLAGYILANRLFLAVSGKPALMGLVREVYANAAGTEKWARLLLERVSREISAAAIAPEGKSLTL
jgi:hypothetical protein